jgi:ribosomal protein L37AE/L43A
MVCGKDTDDDLIECEKCETPCHLKCNDPPLDAVPEGEWLCSTCTAQQEDPSYQPVPSKTPAAANPAKAVSKRKAPAEPVIAKKGQSMLCKLVLPRHMLTLIHVAAPAKKRK